MIKVHVISRGRLNFYLRYKDPATGRRIEKSAETGSRDEACRKALEWQHELNGAIPKTDAERIEELEERVAYLERILFVEIEELKRGKKQLVSPWA